MTLQSYEVRGKVLFTTFLQSPYIHYIKSDSEEDDEDFDDDFDEKAFIGSWEEVIENVFFRKYNKSIDSVEKRVARNPEQFKARTWLRNTGGWYVFDTTRPPYTAHYSPLKYIHIACNSP